MTSNDEETQSAALIGTVLGGRYKLLKLLGEGGMGAVYLGEQMLGSTARKVAVKTLHPHLSHDPKILARFERECGTVAELQHPNTIAIHDFGKSDEGLLYIVMEYVEGKSVGEILEKEGPMPPARVEKVLSQVVGSLTEAHAHGIIHRDLKPDNILLCERAGESDWVEVLDFGIAKRSSHEEDKEEQKLTQQGMVLGTPPYMSPEQFTGKPIDARSDIYSLGVMAYEMLTGRLPFAGNTAWEWATQHMTQPPVPMETTPLGSHVPEPMRLAIMKALEKLPENRFSSVREFMDAFGSGKLAAGAAASPRVATAPLTAPDTAGSSGRGKTEMGAPVQLPAGFGSAAATTSPAVAPAAGTYGTPAAGNHAYAAAGEPGEPARGKGLIFAGIAVLALLSIGGILVGTGVLHGKKKTADFSTIDTAVVPVTNLTPPPPDTSAPDPAKSGTALTTLTPTQHGGTPPKTGGKPAVPPSAAPPQTSGSTPPVTPPPTPPVTPPTPPPTPPVTPPAPPPKPQPAECAQATRFCNNPSAASDPNIKKLCDQHKQACISQGGHFP